MKVIFGVMVLLMMAWHKLKEVTRTKVEEKKMIEPLLDDLFCFGFFFFSRSTYEGVSAPVVSKLGGVWMLGGGGFVKACFLKVIFKDSKFSISTTNRTFIIQSSLNAKVITVHCCFSVVCAQQTC